MDINLIDEIKLLNQQMIKKLFSMKKCEGIDRHPRPLQISILNYLIENKDKNISQKDLENQFKISKAAISDALKSMEKIGLIKRISSTTDARKNIIYPTKESLDMHEELMNNMKMVNDKLLNCLSEEEIQAFLTITSKLIRSMKEGI